VFFHRENLAVGEPFTAPTQPIVNGLVKRLTGREKRGLNMLIFKLLSAVAAAALGAALVLAIPGFSPEVEAGTPPTVVKSDRAEVRPVGTACSQQAWPYFETTCLRDRTQAAGQVRPVRLVTTDRFASK
jgi:hypothetical protein